jgi:hypothetical protein
MKYWEMIPLWGKCLTIIMMVIIVVVSIYLFFTKQRLKLGFALPTTLLTGERWRIPILRRGLINVAIVGILALCAFRGYECKESNGKLDLILQDRRMRYTMENPYESAPTKDWQKAIVEAVRPGSIPRDPRLFTRDDVGAKVVPLSDYKSDHLMAICSGVTVWFREVRQNRKDGTVDWVSSDIKRLEPGDNFNDFVDHRANGVQFFYYTSDPEPEEVTLYYCQYHLGKVPPPSSDVLSESNEKPRACGAISFSFFSYSIFTTPVSGSI